LPLGHGDCASSQPQEAEIRILGLDQSLTRTGWALVEGPPARLPTLMNGWFASRGGGTASFGKELTWLLTDLRPDVVVFERPLERIKIYRKKGLVAGLTTPSSAQLVLPWIAGMIEMACIERDLAYESVPPSTWRARVIGNGAGIMKRAEAKAAARVTCERLGISARNEDVAEASLIALYGVTCDTVRMLTHGAGRG
jgi:Holliday junction resolvasome RuvABC endonuclease subunit